MTSAELIEAVAQETGFTKQEIKAVLASEARIQIAALERGEEVKSLLGKFWPVEQAARMGRNSKTGEEQQIPNRTVIKYKMKKAASESGSADEVA